jgi:hypothetical protein
MTRAQARNMADKIVAAARKAADSPKWTQVQFSVEGFGPNAFEKIRENGGIITGCLPLGWRMSGRGSHTLVVERPEGGQ